jgi:hypothetical protein
MRGVSLKTTNVVAIISFPVTSSDWVHSSSIILGERVLNLLAAIHRADDHQQGAPSYYKA